MRIMSLVSLLNYAFRYVVKTSKHYNIDESHALKHSMDVLGYAKKIADAEQSQFPMIENHRTIIYMAAIGHDMCDKKYMDETEGVCNFQNYLSGHLPSSEIDVIGNIISSMSYSTVKAKGFPRLGEYQMAYHIVREADLLTAYDVERCITFKMHYSNVSYEDAMLDAIELFDKRMLKMKEDKLFLTTFSRKESSLLHDRAILDIENMKTLLQK